MIIDYNMYAWDSLDSDFFCKPDILKTKQCSDANPSILRKQVPCSKAISFAKQAFLN